MPELILNAWPVIAIVAVVLVIIMLGYVCLLYTSDAADER